MPRTGPSRQPSVATGVDDTLRPSVQPGAPVHLLANAVIDTGYSHTEFLAELRAALPTQWADKAEEIWRAHAGSV
jgi:hypothetical protein